MSLLGLCRSIITAYLSIPNRTLLPGLTQLTAKLGFVIDPLSIDWLNSDCVNLIDLCPRPVCGVLFDLFSLGFIPLHSIPSVFRHAADQLCPLFAEAAYGGLVHLVSLLAGEILDRVDPELARDFTDSFLSRSDIDSLISSVSIPFGDALIGRVLGALLGYLDAVYSKTRFDDEHNLVLLRIGRILVRLFLSQVLSLVKQVAATFDNPDGREIVVALVQGYFPHSQHCLLVSFAVETLGAAVALEAIPELCIAVASADPVIASSLAPFLDQPLPPMPTFLSFTGTDKHAEWIKTCRKTIPRDQWIMPRPEVVPVKLNEPEGRVFEVRRIVPERGLEEFLTGLFRASFRRSLSSKRRKRRSTEFRSNSWRNWL
jgi:hypothetical protein